jgi:hypothetical protein
VGVITGGQVLGGSYMVPYQGTVAPSAGTSEVQSLATAGTPAGGTFRLGFDNGLSGTIAYNSGTAALQAVLDAMPQIGSANTLVGGSALNNAAGSTTTVTFQNALAKKNVGPLSLAVNSLTGGTAPSITFGTPTPGADATAREALTGEEYVDTVSGKRYLNVSATAYAPTWTVVGSVT